MPVKQQREAFFGNKITALNREAVHQKANRSVFGNKTTALNQEMIPSAARKCGSSCGVLVGPACEPHVSPLFCTNDHKGA